MVIQKTLEAVDKQSNILEIDATMSEKRRRYDKEFKISAVKMILEEGMNTAQVSRDLGVNENSLYKWKRELANRCE